jgi:Ran GTPase-activating protein (RanGAP) involved in mRNA processing and transport
MTLLIRGQGSYHHIEARSQFLAESRSLKVLKMNNCGLSPRTGKRLQEALTKNRHIQLTEFHASHNKLEQYGLRHLSDYFSEQHCLQAITLSFNGSKKGLSYLFESLLACKDSIKYISVEGNTSINLASLIHFIDIIK